jgi:hypothetical protein
MSTSTRSSWPRRTMVRRAWDTWKLCYYQLTHIAVARSFQVTTIITSTSRPRTLWCPTSLRSCSRSIRYGGHTMLFIPVTTTSR